MTKVEAWYENLRRRSIQTADTYLKRLRKFCRDVGVEPEELVAMSDDKIRDTLLEYVRSNSDKSPGYVNTVIHAVKSWLAFNGRQVSVKVYLRRTSRRERTPTRDEVKKILLAADLRARVLVALVAFSGLRPTSIGNHDGSDGIRLSDLPDLDLDDLTFRRVPAAIVVRPELSKAKHQYITFAGSQTCEYILAYLRLRSRREELGEDSPLVAARSGGLLRTSRISAILAEAIAAAGFGWRPYLLRHYFDTQLLIAEAQKVIPRDYRVFWMGHKGDIEHVYTTNKHRLPEQLYEDMRAKFAEAAKFLETEVTADIAKPRQRVVKPEEIDLYLESGWEFVTTLPDGRVVVRRA